MATSGTTSRTFDVREIIEDAYLAGQGKTPDELNASHISVAIRALDRILDSYGNMHPVSWMTELTTMTLVAGTATYDLASDAIGVVSLVYNQGTGSDVPVPQMLETEYLELPDKDTQGFPNKALIRITPAERTVTLWPVPDTTGATLKYWKIRRLQDAGAMINTIDALNRWNAAITARLANSLFFHLPLAARASAAQEGYRLAAEAERLERAAKDGDAVHAAISIRPA